MALTTYMIGQASDHLDEKHVQLWVLLIKKLPKYKEHAFIYAPLLEERISDTEGTIKARMLNGLMKEIDELGVGEVSIRGDDEGTHWSQTNERMALIEEAFELLFEDAELLIMPYYNNPNGVSVGGVATGSRIVDVCCPVCNVRVWHKNKTTYCGCL